MLFLITIIIVVLIVYVIRGRKQQLSILRRNGIPGPEPHFVSGNLNDFAGMSSIERQNYLIRTYGKVCGYYSGAKPTVLVADPELAKNIQIKDFQHFFDRQHFALRNGTNPIPVMSGAVHRSRGKRWKEIRSVLTPTFSAAKLRAMTPLIDSAIDTLIQLVDNHSTRDEEFDIYELFQGLTTDVIGRTAFGIQTDVQRDPNNKFLKAAKDVFKAKLTKWFYKPITCFPQLDYILYPYRRLEEMYNHRMGRSPTGILLDMSGQIINLRKSDKSLRRKDLLQLMIDSKISGDDSTGMNDEKLTASTDLNENTAEVTDFSSKGNKSYISLTEDEIKANCVLFYEAGYETTSTALGFTAHILVNNPDIQEKVRQEVRELYERDGRLDFNTVNQLDFMECVLNETMRLYPPLITFVTRETDSDYQYKDMTIPMGATVSFPTYYLHHDPDYWSEPEKFDPYRFSAERRHEMHSSSWQPFGSGPRNCVGMRFAFFEMKLALAKLLLRYRLESGPHTELGQHLTTECKLVSLTPKRGVFVKAVKIND